MFWFVFIAASTAAFVLAYGLVNRYISFKLHKNTYPFVLLTLFTNMFTLLSITYILPLDIFYSAQAVDPGNDESSGHENVRLAHTRSYMADTVAGAFSHESRIPNFAVFWSVIYWLEFAICWYIFPVLISYVDLKYLYPRDPSESHRKYVLRRIRGSIVCNVKFYGLCIAGVIAGLVYLKVTTNRGISDFKPLLISLSHLYSLLYMLTLLAIGLIAMPKSLLLETNDERKLFVKLSQNNDELNEAKLIMTDNAERILSLPLQVNDDGINQAINDCKIEVQSIVNNIKLHIPEFSSTAANSNITLGKTNEIYNAFMSAYYNYIYHQGRSDVIIHTLAKSQTKSSSLLGVFFRKFLGTISLLLSVMVVLLEITPAEFAHSWIFAGDSWWHFILEMKLLIYCTLCSLYSMSKFRFQNFHLIPNGNSNPRNALYYSLYSSRLLLPLCFNFITLIPRKGHSVKSGFEKVLYKELEVIKLVNYLNLYLPVIVIVVVILGYCFDLKEKILLRILGEEYYYDFFGINYDSSNANNGGRSRSTTNGYSGEQHRSRMDEDLEYSLQDGRYLFERATSNYVMGTNNRDS